MSGHRSDRQDRGAGGRYSRDNRERSPGRDTRPRREPRQDDYSQGDRRRSSGDGGVNDLPTSVPVPSTGRELPVTGSLMVGSAGVKTALTVNFFPIQSLPIVKSYCYDLRMRLPQSSQRRGSDSILPALQTKVLLHRAVRDFWGEDFLFDGVSMAWSPRELIPVGDTVTTIVDLYGHTQQKPNQVEVSIRNIGLLDIKSLVSYIQGGNVELNYMGNSTIEPLMRWLGALFHKDPASRFFSRPRSNAYFERAVSTTLSLRSTAGVLEALRGVFQTAQIRFGRLGLCVDTTTAAFFTPDKNLIELAHALTGVPLNQDLQQLFLDNKVFFYQSLSRLEGMFMNVKHLNPGQNARKMKLLRINSQDSRETSFEEKDHTSGQEQRTTVREYYLRKHKLTLRFPYLPVAVTNHGFFPIELCYSSSGERYKEALQGPETKELRDWATAPPYIRKQQIMANVESLHWHQLRTPKAFGVSVKTHMLEILGRVLPTPLPRYAAGTDARAPFLGSWNLRNKQFTRPSTINSWGLLYLPGSRSVHDGQLQDFMRSLRSGFGAVGITTPRELPAFLKGNPQGHLKQIVAELLAKTASAFNSKADLLIIILHDTHERLYKVLKKVCEIDFGVSSQVMRVDKSVLGKGQAQYIANIALKVNVKRGGLNHTVSEPLFRKTRWMMLGGDVTHPSPAQLRLNPPPPSFTALSSSCDQDCSQYTSVASAQNAKEEIIADFGVLVRELLDRFQSRNNGYLPEAILYWRDGVSESQFEQVLSSEVGALKEVCESFGVKGPRVTVVCCVKRHHIRFFPLERGDQKGNVLPGTIIENSKGNDFYLVSQTVLQGTARPTRYVTLEDQNGLTVDELQRLTNSLCWNYARATKAVGLVSPAFYAHQSCERARLHLSEGQDGSLYLAQVHEDLKYKMYWQ